MIVRNSDAYFLWLLDKIRIDDINVDDYTELLKILFEIEYTWVIPDDANRASDGLNLRYEFNHTYNGGGLPCSVLEMMIALARDWEHEITYDYRIGDRSGLWFWVMVENLGLLEYTNHQLLTKTTRKSGGKKYLVEYLVAKWLDREFDFDGKGSPFPLKHPPNNQITTKMWSQVQNFVMENVEI